MGAHHFQDVSRFIQEAYRSLAPGAWFLVVDTIGSEHDEADELVDKLERLRDPSHGRNVKGSKWKALAEDAGFFILEYEEKHLELDLEEWMARMRTPEANRKEIRYMVSSAEGGLAEYLQPSVSESRTLFNLREMLMLAKKLGS